MPGKKQPGRLVAGDGPRAVSSPSTPTGRKVPFVDVGVGSNAGGIKGSASSSSPSGLRVPDWRK
jgi:hypothetical protein